MIMATLARQDRASVGVNILAEITAGLWCRNMTLTSGKTVTYEKATTLSVTGVRIDGTALTVRASVNDVESNPGSYYHNGTTLYVSASTGAVYDKTVIAEVEFLFSKQYRIFDNVPYESRIDRAPNLSLRIEKDFGKVNQIGGGDLRLVNHDGYFDSLNTLQWDYGTVTIKTGYDLPNAEQAYADYATVGTWRIKSWSAADDFFTLRLAEIKTRLEKKIPLETYTRADYPQIDEAWIGKVIPRAYGVIYGAQPALVDASTGEFKVAGHAIKSLDGVRLRIDEVWTDATFATKDLSNATFTVTGWQDGYDVSVDFTGRKDSNGAAMVNYADVVEDLLTYIGETSIDSTQLAETRNRLLIGTNRFGKEIHARAVSLYVNELNEAHHFIGKLNETVGGYVFSDANGEYHVGIFEPEPGEGLSVLTERDIERFEPSDDADTISSKVRVLYNERKTGDWRESETFTSEASRLAHGQPSHVVAEANPNLNTLTDVRYYGQRRLLIESNQRKTYRVTTFWNALGWLPGMFIRITYTRRNFNDVVEVLEVNTELTTGRVTLLCGCMRNYAGGCGFIVANSDVLPTDFASETGYGSGSLVWNASWSSAIKKWAKQNVAYVCDANGFASTGDADSWQASRIV